MGRVGGIIEILVDGERFDAKGSFTYNLGTPVKTAVVGADRVHGYKEEPQAPMIEGATTDRLSLDIQALTRITAATVAIRFPNGKTFVLRNAWYAGDGSGTTEEGEFPLKFEGETADII